MTHPVATTQPFPRVQLTFVGARVVHTIHYHSAPEPVHSGRRQSPLYVKRVWCLAVRGLGGAVAGVHAGVDLECLQPGQILKIPPMAVETVVVQRGFTLAQVAAARDTDVEVRHRAFC